MFPAKKELAGGRVKYYLRYRNEKGVLLFYPKTKYPDFYTKKAAEDWINLHRKKFTNIKKQADILRLIKTKTKYPDFDKLVEKFLIAQKRDAPNSWQSSMIYLDRFVLNFYLIKKSVYDTNEWYLYFEDFRNFLEFEATVFGKNKLIDFSTKNHCIRTLNKFLTVMQKNHVLKSASPLKCSPFPKHRLNTKGVDDLFMPDEYKALKNTLSKSKDFFIILSNTGMRFNELYSLSFDDIRGADEAPTELVERFEKYEMKFYGFISLRSQLYGKSRTQAKKYAESKENNEPNRDYIYKRKPLKSFKNINSKNRRIIPIFDKETWNIIVENYERCREQFKFKIHGTNKQDYFLLDVEPNVLRREFIQHTKKSFHSCRHTFITSLVGKYRDMAMTRLITGHRSEAFESYVHIYEQYAEEVDRKAEINPKRLRKAA